MPPKKQVRRAKTGQKVKSNIAETTQPGSRNRSREDAEDIDGPSHSSNKSKVAEEESPDAQKTTSSTTAEGAPNPTQAAEPRKPPQAQDLPGVNNGRVSSTPGSGKNRASSEGGEDSNGRARSASVIYISSPVSERSAKKPYTKFRAIGEGSDDGEQMLRMNQPTYAEIESELENMRKQVASLHKENSSMRK